ncbi:MAG: metallophosphoesterase [Fimbriimonas sp.]
MRADVPRATDDQNHAPEDTGGDDLLLSRRRLLGSAMAASVGLTGGFSLLRDDDRLILERAKLKLSNWTAGKVKIAFLTDPHVNMRDERDRALRAIEMADAEKPDLILLGGDYLNNNSGVSLSCLKEFLLRLSDCQAPCYGVMGNHDYWMSDTETLMKMFQASKVRLLINEVVDFQGFQVYGLDDGLSGYPTYQDPLLAQKNTLCLLHEPDFADLVPSSVSLTISGHSHGGQITFAGIRHTPVGAKKYIAGSYATKGSPLYVSRGVGTTGPRLRLFCPPEVTIFELEGAS